MFPNNLRPSERLAAGGLRTARGLLQDRPGGRSTDGIWAKYWYHAVEQSTGFGPHRPKPDKLPGSLDALHEQCRAYYDTLFAHRLGQ